MAYGVPAPPPPSGDGLSAEINYSTGPNGADLPSYVGQNDQGEPSTPSGAEAVIDYNNSPLGEDVNAGTQVGHLVGNYSGGLAGSDEPTGLGGEGMETGGVPAFA